MRKLLFRRILLQTLLRVSFACTAVPGLYAQLQAEGCATLLQHNELSQAETCARGVLVSNPRNALADEIVGAVRLRQKDYATAVPMLREAIRLEPALIGARLDLGNALVLEGKQAEAEAVFRQVLRYAPHQSDAIFALVRLENAQSHFRQSLQTAQPILPELRRRADGLTVLISDELALNEKALTQGFLADWAALESPSTADSVVLAELLAAKKDPVDAIAVLNRAEAADPEQFDTHFLLGSLYLETQAAERASLEFNAALTLRADCARCLYELGRLADASHQVTEAQSLLLRAQALQPDDADVLIGLGKVLLEMDLPEDAIRNLSAAVRLRPESDKAQYLLASGYTSIKKFGESIAILKLLVVRHPNDPLLVYSLGAVIYLSGDYSTAETLLRRSLLLDPKAIGALYYLSLTLRKQERIPEAEETLRGLLAEAPKHPAGLSALGELLLTQHRYTEARAMLEEAVRLDPSSTSAHYALGRTLARLGERDASKREFEKVELLNQKN